MCYYSAPIQIRIDKNRLTAARRACAPHKRERGGRACNVKEETRRALVAIFVVENLLKTVLMSLLFVQDL